jgi:hypothetical protein
VNEAVMTGRAVKTSMRALYCALAAVATAHADAPLDTEGSGAPPQSTAAFNAVDDGNPLHARLDALASPVIYVVIKDRRHIRQHPGLTMSVVLAWYGRDVRSDVINRVKGTAASAGVTADADVVAEMYAPSVYNDPNLAARMRPTLQRVAGKNHLVQLG